MPIDLFDRKLIRSIVSYVSDYIVAFFHVGDDIKLITIFINYSVVYFTLTVQWNGWVFECSFQYFFLIKFKKREEKRRVNKAKTSGNFLLI